MHRHPHPHRAGALPGVRGQGARRAVAVDGAGACLPQARDALRQDLPHGFRWLLERAAAHRRHGRDAHHAPGDIADAGAPLVLAAARRRALADSLSERHHRHDARRGARALRRPRRRAPAGCGCRHPRARVLPQARLRRRRDREPREWHIDRRCAFRAVLRRR